MVDSTSSLGESEMRRSIVLGREWFSRFAEQRRKHQQTLVDAGRLDRIPKKTSTGLSCILYLEAMISDYVEVEQVFRHEDVGENKRTKNRASQQKIQARKWGMVKFFSKDAAGGISTRIDHPEVMIADLQDGPVRFGNYGNGLSTEPRKNLIALIMHEVEIQKLATE